MNNAWRLALYAAASVILAGAVWHIAGILPPFGAPSSEYGATINAILPSARHVTNMVAAVNFDVRGIDTLGEECILICAVTGTVVLLRATRADQTTPHAGRVPGRPTTERTDATTLLSRAAAVLILLFGIYMVLHGTATPGGGFQGGVIAASSFMLLYLGEGYRTLQRLVRIPVMDILEGGGTFIYIAGAALPLAFGYSALQNILPYGQPKDLFAGGLMVIVNFAVGLSVTGSFGALLIDFMEETREPEEKPASQEEHR
jgi:multicomponent Na+:H+ antiporter subunit B